MCRWMVSHVIKDALLHHWMFRFFVVGFSIQQTMPLQSRRGNFFSDNCGINPREVFNWPPKSSIHL